MEPYIMPIVWVAVLVVSLIVEVQTAELVAVWFIPGALTSLLLSLVGVDEWIQWLVFLVVSAVLLVLAFTVFRKRFLKNHGKEKTDIDLLRRLFNFHDFICDLCSDRFRQRLVDNL